MSNIFLTIKTRFQPFLRNKHMQNNRFILAGLLAIALTACGGGGGDDDGVKVNQPTNGGDNATQELDIGYKIYSNGKRVDDEDDEHADEHPQNRLNVMNLDGRNLVIIPDNVKSQGVLRLEDSTTKRWVGGADLSYARYGVVSYIKENKDYLFFQGIQTKEKDMPTDNGVKYSGNAVAYRIADRALDKGTVEFTANFKDKKMSGSIKLDNFGTLKYDTISIEENEFHGSQWDGKTTNKIQGSFYGAKAAEMAGGFDGQGIKGTFGAKKQSK